MNRDWRSQPTARQGLVRNLNVRTVYERLAIKGPSSRAGLARELALSPAAVGRLVDDLLRAGLVEEGERIASGVGRPQTLVRARAGAAVVAGVSVRSRLLRVHLADLDGRLVGKRTVDRTDVSAAALARQIADIVDELRREGAEEVPLATVVVGIPGVWNDVERRVYAAPNLRVLEGVDALGALEDAMGDVLLGDALLLENDINLAAAGEHEAGAARGVDDFFYLSLGSGVGGAAVIGGVVQVGSEGFAGEVGYLPVHLDGRTDTLESFVARAPLTRFAREVGVEVGADLDVPTALQGEGPATARVADRVAAVLGQALVSVVTVLNPRLIVLGGGLGRVGSTWTTRIRDHLARHVPVTPDVVPTELGREASLLGAVARARALARDVLVSRDIATANPAFERTGRP